MAGKAWSKIPRQPCPECGKPVKSLDQHMSMAHGKEARVNEKPDEKKVEKKVEEKVADPPDLAKAIENIGGRLDRIDTDVCAKFPELCAKVDSLAESIPKRVESIEKAIQTSRVHPGSEEWKGARKADLEHVLFSDCPDCTPVRDEVLSAKRKRLADVEAKVETKVDEVEGKVETKVDEVDAKVDAKVDEPAEPETSPVPKKGFKFDYEKMIYVKRES